MADTVGRAPGRASRAARLSFGFLALASAIVVWAAGGRSAAQPPAPSSPPTVEKVDVDRPPVPTKVEEKAADKPAQPVLQKVEINAIEARDVLVTQQLVNNRSQQRIHFNIDPKTPVKDLLPPPPAPFKARGPLTADDLAKVPEAELTPMPGAKTGEESAMLNFVRDLFGTSDQFPGSPATRQVALQIAKVNHLNAKQVDGFLLALRDQRPDLMGMPFAMGDACRTKGERSKQFNAAVGTVRRALQQTQPPSARSVSGPGAAVAVFTSTAQPQPTPPVVAPAPPPPSQPGQPAPAVVAQPQNFWDVYESMCGDEDRAQAKADPAQCEHVTLARVAALMQILMPESPSLRAGLVKHLSRLSHPEATRALARLAIFSPEEDVRRVAVEALKVRRERDYTEVLLHGLRYPWPVVARRAAETAVKLERTDLVPQLVAMLEEPDPRAPVTKEVGGKQVSVARELVRVNHHRNCLMCHAPGNTDVVSAEALTAPVPVPGEPLTPPLEGYNSPGNLPDLLVRIDVTYLRQDFSAMLPVADAAPWPEMQRFDFLVRERVLAADEAAAFRKELEPTEPGKLPPHRRAALLALRDLTGKDTAPTAEAWRQLLKLPPASGEKARQ